MGALAHIVAVQILLGGLLGARVMSRMIHTPPFNSDGAVIAVALAGLLLCVVVLWRAPRVLRKAVVFGGLMLAAALWRPHVSLTLPQWSMMENPWNGQRYYLIPILIWITLVLTLAAERNRSLRYVGSALVMLLFVGLSQTGPTQHRGPPILRKRLANLYSLPPAQRRNLRCALRVGI